MRTTSEPMQVSTLIIDVRIAAERCSRSTGKSVMRLETRILYALSTSRITD